MKTERGKALDRVLKEHTGKKTSTLPNIIRYNILGWIVL